MKATTAPSCNQKQRASPSGWVAEVHPCCNAGLQGHLPQVQIRLLQYVSVSYLCECYGSGDNRWPPSSVIAGATVTSSIVVFFLFMLAEAQSGMRESSST